MGPEAVPPRTPGTAVSETAGAGAAPPPRSVRSAERPSVDGDKSDLCESRIAIHIKIFLEGGSQAPDYRNWLRRDATNSRKPRFAHHFPSPTDVGFTRHPWARKRKNPGLSTGAL